MGDIPVEKLITVSVDASSGKIVVQRGEKEVQFSIEQLEELFTLPERLKRLESNLINTIEWVQDGKT
jgi:hypothetical protein